MSLASGNAAMTPSRQIWPVDYLLAPGINEFTPPRHPGRLRVSADQPQTARDALLRVDQALVFDSGNELFAGTRYLLPSAEDLTPPERLNKLPEALRGASVRLVYNAGWRNYFHSLVQGLHSFWLFETCQGISAHGGTRHVYLHPEPKLPYREFLACLRFPLDNVVFMHKKAAFRLPEISWLPTSYSQETSPFLRDFAEDLVARSLADDRRSRRIYVSRADTNRRRMKNEAELEAILEGRGFEIVRLSGLGLREQISIFRSADMVIGPHGAGFSNTLFCRPGTRVIELGTPFYLNSCFAAMAGELGLTHSIHLSPTPTPPGSRHDTSWRCDLDNLMQYL